MDMSTIRQQPPTLIVLFTQPLTLTVDLTCIALLPGLRGVDIENRLYCLDSMRTIEQELLWPLLKIKE